MAMKNSQLEALRKVFNVIDSLSKQEAARIINYVADYNDSRSINEGIDVPVDAVNDILDDEKKSQQSLI